jgi:glycosyltransferase involved in cell wall biosynthesis
LAYSGWAEGVLRRTLAIRRPILDSLTYLPHGIDPAVFYPRDRHAARHNFGQRNTLPIGNGKWLNVPDDALMIGCVATNQARKDWGLALATVAEIKKQRKVFFWAHTDVPIRYWSLMDMLNDFDLLPDSVITSIEFTDEQMAWNYSGCDVTLAIGLGEGFGYSAAESLACGTPAVAPNYGGGEFIPKDFLVEPVAWRLEGVYNCLRPVMSVTDFAFRARQAGDAKKLMTGSLLPPRYEWPHLWPEWAEWLKAGLK